MEEYLTLFPCVGIIGPRQCGKTTLLEVLPEHWRRFDLERGSDFQAISQDPDVFLRLHPEFTAVDEAQLLPSLFPALRVAIDADRRRKGRFVITGSSSPSLLTSISESLAGRIGLIEMSPFMWAEIGDPNIPLSMDCLTSRPRDLEAIRTSLKPRGDLQLVHDYWFRGGYPEPWIEGGDRFRSLWMNQYVQTYLYRDVGRLFPGLNQPRFQLFLQMLGGLTGTVLNYADIAKTLGVSQPTVRDYFSIAHGTFVWRRVPAYRKNMMKRLTKHPKGYLRDSGLAHHLMRIGDIFSLMGHPHMGRLFEGMVIEEILRQLQCLGRQFDYCYFRTAAGAEVDLVLEGDFGLLPIEIKHAGTVTPRELRPLKDFIHEQGCPFGIVINNDVEPRLITENILSIPFARL